MVTSAIASFLQSAADMVTPSILNAVMCVLDVIFNALLIPRFGVAGAGAGTALACGVVSLALSGTAEVRQGPGRVSPFSDVKHGAWYFDDVVSAYDRGLVSGMTATTFEPQGTLTGAQAVKLAACMHQLYYDGAVTLKNSDTGPWYRSYADYAVKNRIIYFELADYNATVTRREFVKIFYRALPPGAFNERNDIPDGAIPDVSIYDDGAEQVYAFYRAGILTGYTGTAGFAEHAFGADTTVTRAEVATIMNRMFDADARADFTIG